MQLCNLVPFATKRWQKDTIVTEKDCTLSLLRTYTILHYRFDVVNNDMLFLFVS